MSEIKTTQDLASAHCRSNFFRELAYKTIPGIDAPDAIGYLSDLRRNRAMPVMNDEHLESLIKLYESRQGMYVSVYSYTTLNNKGVLYESAKINRIYLDFDNEEDPQKSIDEALIVIKYLISKKIYCHCYFSGGKGIALYVEFPLVEIKDENKKDVLKHFVDSVILNCGSELKCLDYKVSFDLARVSRIPNTRHKNGLYCIPVTFGDMRKGIEYIKKIAQTKSAIDLEHVISSCIQRNHGMKKLLLDIEKQVIEDRNNLIHSNTKINIQSSLMTMMSAQNHVTKEQIENAKRCHVSVLFGSVNRMKCPLHNGDNPSSFQVDHKKNMWYCHSCGQGGDPIKYIMIKESISFQEAVKVINNI